MPWFALKHMKWMGRQVAPGDLILSDGEPWPCDMKNRAGALLAMEAPEGHHIERGPDQHYFKVVEDAAEPESIQEIPFEPLRLIEPAPVPEPQPEPAPQPPPAPKRGKRLSRRKRGGR